MIKSEGASAPRTKDIACRGCGRTVEVPDPHEGHPYGWYSVSVNMPPALNSASRRPYRWVGMFCSPACLAAHVPALESQRELTRGVYEAE